MIWTSPKSTNQDCLSTCVMMSLRKAYDARDDLMFDEDEEQEEELDEEPEHGKVRLTPAEKDLEFLAKSEMVLEVLFRYGFSTSLCCLKLWFM